MYKKHIAVSRLTHFYLGFKDLQLDEEWSSCRSQKASKQTSQFIIQGLRRASQTCRDILENLRTLVCNKKDKKVCCKTQDDNMIFAYNAPRFAILRAGGTSDGYTQLHSVEVWNPGCTTRLLNMRVCSGLATTREPITSHDRLVARAASSMWEADTGEVFINSTLQIRRTLDLLWDPQLCGQSNHNNKNCENTSNHLQQTFAEIFWTSCTHFPSVCVFKDSIFLQLQQNLGQF